MKNCYLLIFLFGIISFLNAQNDKSEVLKNYSSYTEKKIEKDGLIKEVYLNNGLIKTIKNYSRKQLRFLVNFEYNKQHKINKEKVYFIFNKDTTNQIINTLIYNNNLLVFKENGREFTEKFSKFNKLGKPELIEREKTNNYKKTELPFIFKEILEYDERGNIITSIKHSQIRHSLKKEIETIEYKYNIWNDLIQVYRKFEQKKTFPICPEFSKVCKYKLEKYRYEYNNNGLWIKKYKIINNVETLSITRLYE
ncbi:hypothetical protein OAT18_03550 [Tenacibaculum sp.]|nr:hypothetical protein [Tenacibaculum sp.]